MAKPSVSPKLWFDAEKKITILEKALEFYADHRNHHQHGDAFPGEGVEESIVTKDGGDKARKALGIDL